MPTSTRMRRTSTGTRTKTVNGTRPRRFILIPPRRRARAAAAIGSSRPRMDDGVGDGGIGRARRRRPNRFNTSARARTSRRPSPRRRRYLRNSSTGASRLTRRIFCEAWPRGRCLARMPGGRFAGGTSGPDARCRHRPHRRHSFNSYSRIWPLFLLRTHVAHVVRSLKRFAHSSHRFFRAAG